MKTKCNSFLKYIQRKWCHFIATFRDEEIWKHKIYDYDNYSCRKKLWCDILCFWSNIKGYFMDRQLSPTFFEIARNLSFSCFFCLIPIFVLVNHFATLFNINDIMTYELQHTFLDDVGFLPLIQNTSSYLHNYGEVAIGILVLILTYFAFLKNFEHSINLIWKIETRNRPTFFWHAMLIVFFLCLLFLIIPYSSVFVQTHVNGSSTRNVISALFQWIFFGIALLAIYKYFPNRKINCDLHLIKVSLILGFLLMILNVGADAIIELLFSQTKTFYGILAVAWLFLYAFALVVLIGAFLSYHHIEKDNILIDAKFSYLPNQEQNKLKAKLRRKLNSTKQNHSIESLQEVASDIGLPYSKACEIAKAFKESNNDVQLVPVKYGDFKIYK